MMVKQPESVRCIGQFKRLMFAAAAVGLFHWVFLRGLLDPGVNAVMFAANLLFAFQCGHVYNKDKIARLAVYLCGYLFLFVVFFLLRNSPLLFSLLLIVYSAVFYSNEALAYFVIFSLCVGLVTSYWLPLFIVLSMYYALAAKIYRKTLSLFMLAMFTAGFTFIFLVVFPVLYFSLLNTPQALLSAFSNQEFFAALKVSFLTSTVSVAITLLFGVPFAYIMARLDFPGKRVLDTLIDLPIVIPQTVAGIALLLLLGPKSPLGEFMYKHCNIAVANGYLGIVAAQVFVSAPFLIRSAIHAFENVDVNLEHASRSLGAGEGDTFCRVSLPLARRGIFNGCLLSWARSVSEVGSLMVIAYYPMTAPVFLYDYFTQFGLAESRPLAAILLLDCLWLFLFLRWFRFRRR